MRLTKKKVDSALYIDTIPASCYTTPKQKNHEPKKQQLLWQGVRQALDGIRYDARGTRGRNSCTGAVWPFHGSLSVPAMFVLAFVSHGPTDGAFSLGV